MTNISRIWKLPGNRILFNGQKSGKGEESSNTKLLKVSLIDKTDGTFKLKAQKKSGTARLTVTLASGISKTVKVTIQSAKVKTAKITVSSQKIKLKKGKSYALKPVVTPVTSQDKITFSSSQKSVATVSPKGVIKAKKKGKTKITIQSGTKKMVCTVTVTG